jgi:hypothetical protein
MRPTHKNKIKDLMWEYGIDENSKEYQDALKFFNNAKRRILRRAEPVTLNSLRKEAFPKFIMEKLKGN